MMIVLHDTPGTYSKLAKTDVSEILHYALLSFGLSSRDWHAYMPRPRLSPLNPTVGAPVPLAVFRFGKAMPRL
jgi:hypothetical protein